MADIPTDGETPSATGSQAESVLYDRTGDVVTITLNRPEAMNALDGATREALSAALDAAREDDSRAVLLAGAGKGFCAGQDLHEHGESLRAGAGLGNAVREHYNPLIRELTEMPKPVVAAVNGVAAGAGASLALACDFRVLADSASFLMAFANLGLSADSGASWLLPRVVGRARATELLMLAEPVDARRALELGLATSVAPQAELGHVAGDLASRLAAGPTVAYHTIRSSLDYAQAHELDETLELEAELQATCADTADHRNAVEAFLNKQRPTFEGR